MTTQQTVQGMQLYHAMFELEDRAIANQRTLERLMAAVLAGGAAILSGPAGVGKSHAAAAVATVFGLPYRSMAAPDHLAGFPADNGAGILVVEDIDRAPESVQNGLAESVRERSDGLLVGTVTTGASGNDEAVGAGTRSLTRRLRDETLMFIEVPYPDAAQERAAVQQSMSSTRSVDRILNPRDLNMLRTAVGQVVVDDPVVDYAVRLVHATRHPHESGLENLVGLMSGVSPRASIALVSAARAAAFVGGRQVATMQDVYDVAYEVLIHRVEPTPVSVARGIEAGDLLVELLTRVPATST